MNQAQMNENLATAATHLEGILGRAKILPEEQVVLLIRRARSGDERAIEQVVLHTARMAWSSARATYKQWYGALPASADPCEAFNDGIAGIMRAIDLFDESRGFKFSTFAQYHIDNKVRRSIKNLIGPYHIPEAKLTGAGRDNSIPFFAYSLEYQLDDDGGDGSASTLGELLEAHDDLHDVDDELWSSQALRSACRIGAADSVISDEEIIRQALRGFTDVTIARSTGGRITTQGVSSRRRQIADRLAPHMSVDPRSPGGEDCAPADQLFA